MFLQKRVGLHDDERRRQAKQFVHFSFDLHGMPVIAFCSLHDRSRLIG